MNSFAVALAFVAQALATPAPQGSTAVIHCDTPLHPKCPVGFQCCGPISATTGGM
ncbi:hypothetical protein GALMADRAFT_144431 [Galerina marginata CBS 339.88]|uniref:Hydrophobin n=1 Tax=Galerina marginata (strain CBS 339.88) TaxID=685588 RepID=A0A067SJC1_GALM3|nr:hypothetical protein GALMADRAFT_144431 [Galerina marginata CBS 339.88]